MLRKGVAFDGLLCYHSVMDSIIERISTEDARVFRKKILDWYDQHRRVLPWRALKGDVANPYHVWLSEIMLQQTTVQAVIPYFLKFVKRWPDVHALASADNEDVMSYWAGLGYYARARNLHKCAKVISHDFFGIFPQEQKQLLLLPGIGDYTSAAIRSIAFDKPSVVVDGNIERVMARYHAVEEAMPKGKKALKAYATKYADAFEDRPSDYAQALMDLGATICTPKSPLCAFCPINDECQAYKSGRATVYPVKAKKIPKPKRYGYVYVVRNSNGDILFHKRPAKGLLGGMFGLPTSGWVNAEDQRQHLNVFESLEINPSDSHIRHVFTHFDLRLDIFEGVAKSDETFGESFIWHKRNSSKNIGLPTVFKKAYDLVNI